MWRRRSLALRGDFTRPARRGTNAPLPFWLAQLGVWGAFALSGAALFTLGHPILTPRVAALLFPSEALIGATLTTALRYAYRRLPAPTSAAREVAAVLCVVALCLAGGAAWVVVERPMLGRLHVEDAFDTVRSPGVPRRAPPPLRPSAVAFSAGVLGAWSIAYFGQRYRRQARREADERARALSMARDARLAMLRYQVNPHFLFNTLTALSGLVEHDATRARRVVLELSRFLRYSLLAGEGGAAGDGATGGGLVPLEDELDAVRAYLAVEEARFGPALEVSYAIEPEAVGALVPPFLVHPLVENAVRHGYEAGAPTLHVHVAAGRDREGGLRIGIGNTGRIAGSAPDDARASGGSGVGLRNVRERLVLAYGSAATLLLEEEGGWVWARIRVGAPRFAWHPGEDVARASAGAPAVAGR